MELHIGIDDTDSRNGGCTTYIAARLVEKLTGMGAKFIDYPNIIRLNPNIPYKTRGNAAVALRVAVPRGYDRTVKEAVLDEVEANSELDIAGTDPAVAFIEGKPPLELKLFSRKALYDLLDEHEALETLKRADGTAATYRTGLGLVGAVSAIGLTLNGDHTFELVAYREKRNCGTPRRVSEASVVEMDRRTAPGTFNNYDYRNKRMLVTPHGPDPVLLGIRGESPQIVIDAFHMLEIQEPVERWVIFRTNHGTDSHLTRTPARVKPFRPSVLKGVVVDTPERIRGSHVFFTLKYKGGTIRCAIFEPTGSLRQTGAELLPGDHVTVSGGIKKHSAKNPVSLNVEKLLVERLANDFITENPMCPMCGKHLKSAGKGQGFRCARCSFKAPKARRIHVRRVRKLRPGIYLPDAKAHRHLAKPLSRYGLEKRRWASNPPSGGWHDP